MANGRQQKAPKALTHLRAGDGAGKPGNRVLRILGVADGARTHDNWNHNPGLYQLSYSHHWYCCLTALQGMAPCRKK